MTAPRTKSRPKLPSEQPAEGEKRGRGRPRVALTDDLRRQVEELVACGMQHEAIATAIGVSDKWLRQRMRLELDNGGAKRRAEVVGMLFKAARSGNVAAIKHLDLQTAAAMAQQQIEAPAAPARRIGFREQQRADALAAGENSSWGSDLHTGASRSDDAVKH